MNHSATPNTLLEHFGKIKFVYAAEPLKAGDELTITYGANKGSLKSKWGIDEE